MKLEQEQQQLHVNLFKTATFVQQEKIYIERFSYSVVHITAVYNFRTSRLCSSEHVKWACFWETFLYAFCLDSMKRLRWGEHYKSNRRKLTENQQHSQSVIKNENPNMIQLGLKFSFFGPVCIFQSKTIGTEHNDCVQRGKKKKKQEQEQSWVRMFVCTVQQTLSKIPSSQLWTPCLVLEMGRLFSLKDIARLKS